VATFRVFRVNSDKVNETFDVFKTLISVSDIAELNDVWVINDNSDKFGRKRSCFHLGNISTFPGRMQSHVRKKVCISVISSDNNEDDNNNINKTKF